MPLPMPGSPGKAFVESANTGSEIMNRIMQNRQRQQELEEQAKYHQATNQLDRDKFGLEKQKLPFSIDLIKAQIEANKALANQRNTGQSGLGTGPKEEMFSRNLVNMEYPELNGDPKLIYEAHNTLSKGGRVLSNKMVLNEPSESLKRSFGRLYKGTTDAQQRNQALTAKQAEAEMPVYDKAIKEGVEPYGTTIFNKSPQQIKDALNVNDKDAQKRLGKYLAAQQLLYDRAALTLRINSLPPGVTVADEIKKLSFQTVDAKFPLMSAEARKVAAETVAKALSDGLKARQKVGISAYDAVKDTGSQAPSSSSGGKTAEQWAQEAIQAGATEAEVNAMLQQLKGQG